MWQGFSRNSISRITYFYLCISYFITHCLIQTQSDAPLFRIFDCVGNKIIQNNGNDFLIEKKKHFFFLYLNLEVNLGLLI